MLIRILEAARRRDTWRRSSRAMAFLWILALGCGAIALSFQLENRAFDSRGVAAEATVHGKRTYEKRERSSSTGSTYRSRVYEMRVGYQTPGGPMLKKVEVTSGYYDAAPKVGGKLAVVYMPDDPAKLRVDPAKDRQQMFWVLVMTALFGSGALAYTWYELRGLLRGSARGVAPRA